MSCWSQYVHFQAQTHSLSPLSLRRSLLGLSQLPCVHHPSLPSKPWILGNLLFLSSSTLGYEKVGWKYRASLPPKWNLHMGVGFPWLHLVPTGPSFLSLDQNSLTEFSVFMAPSFSSQQFTWSHTPQHATRAVCRLCQALLLQGSAFILADPLNHFSSYLAGNQRNYDRLLKNLLELFIKLSNSNIFMTNTFYILTMEIIRILES